MSSNDMNETMTQDFLSWNEFSPVLHNKGLKRFKICLTHIFSHDDSVVKVSAAAVLWGVDDVVIRSAHNICNTLVITLYWHMQLRETLSQMQQFYVNGGASYTSHWAVGQSERSGCCFLHIHSDLIH